jgi:hypothetical protein
MAAATAGKLDSALLSDVRIPMGQFRNFAGEKRKFNEAGKRNFTVALSDEVAKAMEKAGWNVKYLQPRLEEDVPQPILKVNVNYASGTPPKIVMLTTKGKTELDANSVRVLDYADITHADLIINSYPYEDAEGKRKFSAWLKTLFVTIQEDELEMKYTDIPESGEPPHIEPDSGEPPF